MPKIDDVFNRLKKNKLAVPALVVGGGIGLFVLLKNGGQSGFDFGGGGSSEADDIQPPDDGLIGGIGGGETDLSGIQSQIDDISSNQEVISGSFTDALNKAIDWFTGALGEQQSYIDNQLEGLANSIPDFNDFPTGEQELGFSDGFLGNFLDTIAGFVPQQLPEQFSFSPQLPIENIVPLGAKIAPSGNTKQYVSSPAVQQGSLRGVGGQALDQNLTVKSPKTKSVLPRVTEQVNRIINKTVKTVGVPQSQQPVYRPPKNGGSGGGSRDFGKISGISKQPVYRKPTVVKQPVSKITKQPVYRQPTVSKQPVYRPVVKPVKTTTKVVKKK